NLDSLYETAAAPQPPQSIEAKSVLDGYSLVPNELIEKMYYAGQDAPCGIGRALANPIHVWEAEIAAAPQPDDKVQELEKAMWTLKQIAHLDHKNGGLIGTAVFMATEIIEAMKGE